MRCWISRTAATACLVSLGVLAGCSDSATVPADAPEGHTVMKEGVPHKSGLKNPQENCSACHGANLGGGTNGEPSCYLCHGKKW
jgi:hypothetical protein